jgi:hypothetical protein
MFMTIFGVLKLAGFEGWLRGWEVYLSSSLTHFSSPQLLLVSLMLLSLGLTTFHPDGDVEDDASEGYRDEEMQSKDIRYRFLKITDAKSNCKPIQNSCNSRR